MSSSSMHVAKTGLTAQQTRMQVISNNLANVNTIGFKSDRINFESLLYQITVLQVIQRLREPPSHLRLRLELEFARSILKRNLLRVV